MRIVSDRHSIISTVANCRIKTVEEMEMGGAKLLSSVAGAECSAEIGRVDIRNVELATTRNIDLTKKSLLMK